MIRLVRALAVVALFASPSVAVVASAQTPKGERNDENKKKIVFDLNAARSGPPWLGVTLEKDDGKPGVEVSAALKSSPAEKSGVRRGDRIIAIDGEQVDTLGEIRMQVGAHDAGDRVEVVVRRGGERKKLEFVIEYQPPRQKIVENQLLGREAPNFDIAVMEPQSKKMELRDLKGKPTIIDFWATWCAPCRKTSEELANLKEKYGDAIHVVGVTSESKPTVRKFLNDNEAHYPVGRDTTGVGHTRYFVSSFPMLILLDADQKVAAIILGAGNESLLDRKLDNLVTAP